MSNDLQIIYVTFPSIIVFAEDINCVTNIKLSAKRAELSSLLSENAEPSAPRQTCIWPSFVQHLTQCEGFLLEMPTWVADDVCVSSVLWLRGPRLCAALSPPSSLYSPVPLATIDPPTVSNSFAFSRISYRLNHTICSLGRVFHWPYFYSSSVFCFFALGFVPS